MGDRCYSRVVCRPKDARLFIDELGYCSESDYDVETIHLAEEPYVELVDDQANYGHFTDLCAFGKQGMVFIAFNDGGGEYGPCMVVGTGRQWASTETNDSHDVTLRLTEDGRLLDLDSAIEFHTLYLKASERLRYASYDLSCPTSCAGGYLRQPVVGGPYVCVKCSTAKTEDELLEAALSRMKGGLKQMTRLQRAVTRLQEPKQQPKEVGDGNVVAEA